MKYELWKSDECYSFFPENNSKVRDCVLQEPNAVLINIIEAQDWTQAMTLYHEYMGWGPYKKIDD